MYSIVRAVKTRGLFSNNFTVEHKQQRCSLTWQMAHHYLSFFTIPIWPANQPGALNMQAGCLVSKYQDRVAITFKARGGGGQRGKPSLPGSFLWLLTVFTESTHILWTYSNNRGKIFGRYRLMWLLPPRQRSEMTSSITQLYCCVSELSLLWDSFYSPILLSQAGSD